MARQRTFQSEEIIDRSIDVFMTKGYEGTSVQDLVNATGLHPGSLYNAFGSKEGLFEAALERFNTMSPFNRLLCLADTAPPRDSIKRLLAGVVDPDAHADGVTGCLISFAAAELGTTNSKLSENLHRSFRHMEDRLCRFIERGQKDGEFASTRDPRELAQFLLSIVQGIQVMSKVTNDKAYLSAATEVAFAALDQIDV